MLNGEKLRGPIDVLICVHNSPEDVRLCLGSVLETLAQGDRLIVVDDGSADETRRICEDAARKASDSVTLVRRPEGSGFCRAANAGLRETTAPDVVVLNSDTIVVGDWLDRISACLHANWQIGMAGPLSNAGGWQSIPEYATGGPANNAVKSDPETLRAIYDYCNELKTRYDYPVVEQVNGFCLGLRREVLETVGLFDEVRFPMGYGEESDLTFRAWDAGFLSAIAIDCFVYHAKTKSYTSESRKTYIEAGKVHLAEAHGHDRIQRAVKSTQENPFLGSIREEARKIFHEKRWLLKPTTS